MVHHSHRLEQLAGGTHYEVAANRLRDCFPGVSGRGSLSAMEVRHPQSGPVFICCGFRLRLRPEPHVLRLPAECENLRSGETITDTKMNEEDYTRARGDIRGFTLLELSIVLVLIAVIMSGGLAILTSSLQASQFNATVDRMDAIEKTLLEYAVANNRIPCPSDLTQAVGSATYGMEAGAGAGSSPGTATGACTGASMLPQANFKTASGMVEGGVPTRALQLPDDYMYDGWGRRFRYAAASATTATGSLPAGVPSLCGSAASGITVNDVTGAARTTAAIYALISHGSNGHGAYTSGGVVVNGGSVNTDELTNCHCTSAGVYGGTYTSIYVEKTPTQDTTNALDNFDDIVTFKEGWQMQAQNFPVGPMLANCLFVGDTTNNRIRIVNGSGMISTVAGNGTQ